MYEAKFDNMSECPMQPRYIKPHRRTTSRCLTPGGTDVTHAQYKYWHNCVTNGDPKSLMWAADETDTKQIGASLWSHNVQTTCRNYLGNDFQGDVDLHITLWVAGQSWKLYFSISRTPKLRRKKTASQQNVIFNTILNQSNSWSVRECFQLSKSNITKR